MLFQKQLLPIKGSRCIIKYLSHCNGCVTVRLNPLTESEISTSLPIHAGAGQTQHEGKTMTAASMLRLVKSLIHEIALVMIDAPIDENDSQETRTYFERMADEYRCTVDEEAHFYKIVLHQLCLSIRDDMDAYIFAVRQGKIKNQLSKTMWQNYFALTQDNSDLARYHELDTMRLAYLIARGTVEHKMQFQSPFARDVRQKVKRNSIVFARQRTKFERHVRYVQDSRDDRAEFTLYNQDKPGDNLARIS